MTFITVIKANTFAEGTVDIHLEDGIFSGTFTGNLTGNVGGASIVESETVCATTSIITDDFFPKTNGANVNVNTDLNVIGNVYANGLPLGTGNVSGVADLLVNGNLDMNCANIINIDSLYPKHGENLTVVGNLAVTGNIIGGLPIIPTIRCLSGTRVGAGSVTLSTSPTIPTDEVWGFTVDVVGREVGTANIFYESISVLAHNNAGNVNSTTLTTISSYGVGALSGDSVDVQGNANTVEVVVTTSSTGTTNWTGKLQITSVS